MSKTELPFAGKDVYFSASIKGVVTNPDIGPQLVKAMQIGGANVLSEHVAFSDPSEMYRVFYKNTGIMVTNPQEMARVLRQVDMRWVDQSTHVVSVVDGPSHGVGMEIERALLKPERGLPQTQILALIHEQNLNGLSAMIRGIDAPEFHLKTYTSVADAKRKVARFLRDS
jgi:hypothetical protein